MDFFQNAIRTTPVKKYAVATFNRKLKKTSNLGVALNKFSIGSLNLILLTHSIIYFKNIINKYFKFT